MPAVKFFAGLDLKQKSSFLDGHYLKQEPQESALYPKSACKIIKGMRFNKEFNQIEFTVNSLRPHPSAD